MTTILKPFSRQTVIEAFGSVVMLSGIVGILVQISLDKGYHILSKHRFFPAVFLALSRNTVASPVFLGGIAGKGITWQQSAVDSRHPNASCGPVCKFPL